MEVVFAGGRFTADTLIARRIAMQPADVQVVVVSADQEVQRTASRAGVSRMTPLELGAELGVGDKGAQALDSASDSSRMPTRLEDKVDPETLRRLEELATSRSELREGQSPECRGNRSGGGVQRWYPGLTAAAARDRLLTLNSSARVLTSRLFRRTGAATKLLSTPSWRAITSSSVSRPVRTSWPAATPRISSRRACSASTRRSATTATTAWPASAASPSSASPGRSSPPSRRRPGRSTRRSTATSRSASPPATRRTTATAPWPTSCPVPPADPVSQVISSEEVDSLTVPHEHALRPRRQGAAAVPPGARYERIAAKLGCDCKTVDNALQRIKRKVDLHLEGRRVPS